MAAPKSIIELVLRVISVIPFARTVDEIDVARTHLSISCCNLGASRIAVRNFWVYDLIAWHGGRFYYGDYHSMAIAIEVSSQAW
jgi:hypothetical protein